MHSPSSSPVSKKPPRQVFTVDQIHDGGLKLEKLRSRLSSPASSARPLLFFHLFKLDVQECQNYLLMSTTSTEQMLQSHLITGEEHI